uniref:Uncharacterized protein n=1 Tax=Pelusios castaneus TaxID=367368 RepID=A0A8C8S3F7_9SAUR
MGSSCPGELGSLQCVWQPRELTSGLVPCASVSPSMEQLPTPVWRNWTISCQAQSPFPAMSLIYWLVNGSFVEDLYPGEAVREGPVVHLPLLPSQSRTQRHRGAPDPGPALPGLLPAGSLLLFHVCGEEPSGAGQNCAPVGAGRALRRLDAPPGEKGGRLDPTRHRNGGSVRALFGWGVGGGTLQAPCPQGRRHQGPAPLPSIPKRKLPPAQHPLPRSPSPCCC